MIKRILSKQDEDYKKLENVAEMLQHLSPNHAKYVVRDVYLDFGANLMWTTICREEYRECQVLSPREWKEIMLADSFSELKAIVDEIRNDKYFGDK